MTDPLGDVIRRARQGDRVESTLRPADPPKTELISVVDFEGEPWPVEGVGFNFFDGAIEILHSNAVGFFETGCEVADIAWSGSFDHGVPHGDFLRDYFSITQDVMEGLGVLEDYRDYHAQSDQEQRWITDDNRALALGIRRARRLRQDFREDRGNAEHERQLMKWATSPCR